MKTQAIATHKTDSGMGGTFNVRIISSIEPLPDGKVKVEVIDRNDFNGWKFVVRVDALTPIPPRGAAAPATSCDFANITPAAFSLLGPSDKMRAVAQVIRKHQAVIRKEISNSVASSRLVAKWKAIKGDEYEHLLIEDAISMEARMRGFEELGIGTEQPTQPH